MIYSKSTFAVASIICSKPFLFSCEACFSRSTRRTGRRVANSSKPAYPCRKDEKSSKLHQQTEKKHMASGIKRVAEIKHESGEETHACLAPIVTGDAEVWTGPGAKPLAVWLPAGIQPHSRKQLQSPYWLVLGPPVACAGAVHGHVFWTLHTLSDVSMKMHKQCKAAFLGTGSLPRYHFLHGGMCL